jgi:hypothetical protein
MLSLDIKDWLAIAAGVLILVNHLNYIRTIFTRRTKPHFFSWLIWTITQGTAAAAVIVGGGGAAGMAILITVFLVGSIALLSLKYGTKHIRKRDVVMLITALIAVFVWWQLDNPFLAVILITIVDIIGYLLTLLKIDVAHCSEPLVYWSFDLLTYILLVAALEEYNFLTAGYLVAVCGMSVIIVSVLYYHRFIKKGFLNKNPGCKTRV